MSCSKILATVSKLDLHVTRIFLNSNKSEVKDQRYLSRSLDWEFFKASHRVNQEIEKTNFIVKTDNNMQTRRVKRNLHNPHNKPQNVQRKWKASHGYRFLAKDLGQLETSFRITPNTNRAINATGHQKGFSNTNVQSSYCTVMSRLGIQQNCGLELKLKGEKLKPVQLSRISSPLTEEGRDSQEIMNT